MSEEIEAIIDRLERRAEGQLPTTYELFIAFLQALDILVDTLRRP